MWLSISFEIDATAAEAVTDALLEEGALSVDVEDAAAGSAQEDAVFAEGGREAPRLWRSNRVRALVPAGADAVALLAAACARAGIASPPGDVRAVADRDWVRETQAQFAPIRISPRLWIVPTWHAAPDAAALNIVLDPGLAFGTGGHATTRLCLTWLEHAIAGGESVIDYGCGSGVLAIAAMKLGAASAVGIDIDAQALLAARANAIQNQVQIEFRPAADGACRPADIVVANILARPLIVLAPLIAGLTVSGGRVALAGILSAQAPELRAAYGEWFDLGQEGEEDGWVLLAGTRKEPRA
jgi:ribosomal protein L11 methyltransferase